MFLFQYHEDNLRLLEEEREREERGKRLLRELHELRSAASPVAERERARRSRCHGPPRTPARSVAWCPAPR